MARPTTGHVDADLMLLGNSSSCGPAPASTNSEPAPAAALSGPSTAAGTGVYIPACILDGSALNNPAIFHRPGARKRRGQRASTDRASSEHDATTRLSNPGASKGAVVATARASFTATPLNGSNGTGGNAVARSSCDTASMYGGSTRPSTETSLSSFASCCWRESLERCNSSSTGRGSTESSAVSTWGSTLPPPPPPPPAPRDARAAFLAATSSSLYAIPGTSSCRSGSGGSSSRPGMSPAGQEAPVLRVPSWPVVAGQLGLDMGMTLQAQQQLLQAPVAGTAEAASHNQQPQSQRAVSMDLSGTAGRQARLSLDLAASAGATAAAVAAATARASLDCADTVAMPAWLWNDAQQHTSAAGAPCTSSASSSSSPGAGCTAGSASMMNAANAAVSALQQLQVAQQLQACAAHKACAVTSASPSPPMIAATTGIPSLALEAGGTAPGLAALLQANLLASTNPPVGAPLQQQLLHLQQLQLQQLMLQQQQVQLLDEASALQLLAQRGSLLDSHLSAATAVTPECGGAALDAAVSAASLQQQLELLQLLQL